MCKFVKLHTKEQGEIKEIYVNLEFVATAEEVENGTLIIFAIPAVSNTMNSVPYYKVRVTESLSEISL